ncbi:MAG TPA: cysteine dioxygenase family protein [Pyrinomonadaceae bacterium]|jgi:cysteine dioxygenase|nr:cysteine dioxygenase family protein [Pyrinomonadaceae bacterium]
MPTLDAQTTTRAHVPAEGGRREGDFSLRSLAGALEKLSARPELSQVDEWMRHVEVSRDELRPYVGFKEGTYARHRVFVCEHAELLVLCWRPGQRTPIHDHAGSFGSVRVLEGFMWETLFEMDGREGLLYKSARDWTPGHVTGADIPDIHQLGNPDVSGRDLVTLHLYSPPLTSLNVYKVGRKESTSTLWMNSWNPTV